MDDGTAMAAAVAQPRPLPPRAAAGSSPRGFFSFLKDGVLVTTRNRGLFLSLAALDAARSLALLAARIVALRYMGPTLGEDRLRLFAILDKVIDGHSWLLPAGAACLAVKVAIMVLGLTIKAATACAAVASCSNASIDDGGPGRTTLTLASLLGKVRRNLRRPMATAVFVKVVWWASVVSRNLVTVAVLVAVEAYAGRGWAELVWLVDLTALTPLVFIHYFVARDVAVVVSVAEPDLRGGGGGALRRARRLTRGGKKMAQVTLHGLLSWALNKAVWRVYDVAMVRVPYSIAAAWLGAVLVYMLVGTVEVLYTATVTAYYFDCKRTDEEKAGHLHTE